jgi:hypothetical protein
MCDQVTLSSDTATIRESAFLASLGVSRLPSRDLFTLDDGMFARLAALEASKISRAFAPPESPRTGLRRARRGLTVMFGSGAILTCSGPEPQKKSR